MSAEQAARIPVAIQIVVPYITLAAAIIIMEADVPLKL